MTEKKQGQKKSISKNQLKNRILLINTLKQPLYLTFGLLKSDDRLPDPDTLVFYISVDMERMKTFAENREIHILKNHDSTPFLSAYPTFKFMLLDEEDSIFDAQTAHYELETVAVILAKGNGPPTANISSLN